MLFLKALLIIVLVLSCLMLIGLVLLQKSKSEGLGLAFGAGAGESLFGARAGNVLSKATVVLGIVFMGSSLALGVMFAQKDATLMDGVASDPAQPAAVQPSPLQGPETSTEPQVIPVNAPATEAPAIEMPAEEVPAAE
jgi:preprotein translocase subunit SecG